MKFKYIGSLPIKDSDLVIGKVFKPTDIIVKGTVFEVPDDNKLLIQRVKLSGCYEEYVAPKVTKSFKKYKKTDKEEDKEE